MTKYQEAYLTLNLGDYSTQLFIDITIYNKPVPMDLLPVAMQVSLLKLCPPRLYEFRLCSSRRIPKTPCEQRSTSLGSSVPGDTLINCPEATHLGAIVCTQPTKRVPKMRAQYFHNDVWRKALIFKNNSRLWQKKLNPQEARALN